MAGVTHLGWHGLATVCSSSRRDAALPFSNVCEQHRSLVPLITYG